MQIHVILIMHMIFKYGVNIITFIQFITSAILGFANGILSITTVCTTNGINCVTNAIGSLGLMLITALWFLVIWIVGLQTQEKRSKRLARMLIVMEGFTALVALYNIHTYTNYLGLFTSSLDLLFCIWTILLAFKISRANGGRVPVRKRQRRSKKLSL